MKKANLKMWKTARKAKKSKISTTLAAIKDDRALFARFLVVTLSRPDINLKESISSFELQNFLAHYLLVEFYDPVLLKAN
jgi:hypothetical protein